MDLCKHVLKVTVAMTINNYINCFVAKYFIHWSRVIRQVTMSFEIGKIYEGLHEGRWFICTIVSQEDEGYKVTFMYWSSRFSTVLTADCIRPHSTEIDCRSGVVALRGKWRLPALSKTA